MKSPSRVTRSREAARSFYTRLSGYYDTLARSSEKGAIEAGMALLHVTRGERALEIGCGTGHALLALADAVGPTGSVHGADLAEGMLRRSRARAVEGGSGERVHLAQADAVHLPYCAGAFDALFASFVVELFDTSDIPAVLGECRRVLAPDGRLAVVAMSSREPRNPMVRLYEWAHRVAPTWVDCRPIDAAAALHQAGLEVALRREMRIWGLPVDLLLARRSGEATRTASTS